MSSSRHPAALPWWVSTPIAVGGGLLMAAAFPPYWAWPLGIVSVGVLAAVVPQASRLRGALGLGLAYALGLLVPGIWWQLALLPAAFFGLLFIESLYYVAGAGLMWAVRHARWRPLWFAGIYLLVEYVFSRFPFGGFPWLRLGYPLLDSPLAGFLPLGGIGLTSFLGALIGTLGAELVLRRTPRLAVVAVASTLVIAGIGAWGASWRPVEPATPATVNVGYVQGGVNGGGIYGLGEVRTTTRAHLTENKNLAARVQAGELPKPDLIVMPENTTDMDPLLDPETRTMVDRMVSDAGVPVLVGVPQSIDENNRKTMSLWWTRNGPTAEYQKTHLVPFGEWVPFREIFQPIVPELAYVGAQTQPGTEPNVVRGVLNDGTPLNVGVAICYDVVYPETVAWGVREGAEIMVVQSNNAMFAGTAQLEQQFLMTRARAAELRRPILVVTVSGTSGYIEADGSAREFPPMQPISGVVTMQRLTALTPYAAGGWLIEHVLAGGVAIALALRGAWAMRENRRSPQPAASDKE